MISQRSATRWPSAPIALQIRSRRMPVSRETHYSGPTTRSSVPAQSGAVDSVKAEASLFERAAADLVANAVRVGRAIPL